MAKLTLTFDPPAMNPSLVAPIACIHDDILYPTSNGPKLGSELQVGDVFRGLAAPFVIATITPEI